MAKVTIEWGWEEAFDKFGFGDGDGWNGTDEVVNFLYSLGWEVECDTHGLHNYHIFDMFNEAEVKCFEFDGYIDPREVLPVDLVVRLDEQFN